MADFPFDIVGFDLDGTLLDTHADLGHALNHALAQIGRAPVPIAQVRGLIGGGGRKMLERALILSGGVSEVPMSRLHADLIAHYEAHIAAATRPFPGTEAMLDALAARGVRLAVVTNKLEHLARKVLDALGLSPRFYTILGGDSLGPGTAKPAPDLLHAMLARAGLGAGTRAAYVGDSSFDTGAARAAGMPCVAVSFGFSDRPVEELGADAVIDHFDELLPALLRF